MKNIFFTCCQPGQIWERKLDLYQKLVEPDSGAFNYKYWETDLNSWHESPLSANQCLIPEQ